MKTLLNFVKKAAKFCIMNNTFMLPTGMTPFRS